MKVEAKDKLTVKVPGREDETHAKGTQFDMEPRVARAAAAAGQVKIVDPSAKASGSTAPKSKRSSRPKTVTPVPTPAAKSEK